MECRHCGTSVTNPAARFCPNCGKPLEDAAAPAPVQRAAPKANPGAKDRKPERNRAHPSWDTYQDPNSWMKWVILAVVLVVAAVGGMIAFSLVGLKGESILSLFEKEEAYSSSVSQPEAALAPSASPERDQLMEELPTGNQEQPAGVQDLPSAEATDTRVVFRNGRPNAVLTVDGRSVPYEMVGTDLVVDRAHLPDVAQVRVVAPVGGGGWVTAAVWYNYRYGNDMTFGDENDYGSYVSCTSDGEGKPGFKVVDVLTWAYFRGYLQSINEQDMRYMVYSTDTNIEQQKLSVFSSFNSKNTYDLNDFSANCSGPSIIYEPGRVLYNASFRCQSSDGTKIVNSYRTIELIWTDGQWKVNRTALMSSEDFAAGRYAALS